LLLKIHVKQKKPIKNEVASSSDPQPNPNTILHEQEKFQIPLNRRSGWPSGWLRWSWIPSNTKHSRNRRNLIVPEVLAVIC